MFMTIKTDSTFFWKSRVNSLVEWVRIYVLIWTSSKLIRTVLDSSCSMISLLEKIQRLWFRRPIRIPTPKRIPHLSLVYQKRWILIVSLRERINWNQLWIIEEGLCLLLELSSCMNLIFHYLPYANLLLIFVSCYLFLLFINKRDFSWIVILRMCTGIRFVKFIL